MKSKDLTLSSLCASFRLALVLQEVRGCEERWRGWSGHVGRRILRAQLHLELPSYKYVCGLPSSYND